MLQKVALLYIVLLYLRHCNAFVPNIGECSGLFARYIKREVL